MDRFVQDLMVKGIQRRRAMTCVLWRCGSDCCEITDRGDRGPTRFDVRGELAVGHEGLALQPCIRWIHKDA
jgi:hypothetical protein